MTRRAHRDTTPQTVHITPGTLVCWNGKQRGGTIHNIPAHTAKQWIKRGWAQPDQSGGAPHHPSGKAERPPNPPPPP
ncbi:hypothetical protein, partial [Mycobacterium heckeshornense]|uniref:hypothetical protein n=1 Tax=Mycobacterium heckeshornense TaxID=110505 RepID=UPI001C0EF6D1